MTSSAPTRPIEVPPFQLQPLVSSLPQPSHPSFTRAQGHAPSNSGDFAGALFSRVMGGGNQAAGAGQTPERAAKDVREIRCAQAYNKDIFIGCSDGTLIRYSVREDDALNGDPYTIVSQQTAPGNKPIDKIALVPSAAKALVLSGGIVHFYTLPAFDPLPQSIISPLRGVVTFTVDCQPPTSPSQPVTVCVVRRRTIVLYLLRERLAQNKDIPFPNGVHAFSLSGSVLTIADPRSYWMVNTETIEAVELVEWNQSPSPQPSSSPVRPFVLAFGEGEWMLVMWNGSNALGMFFTSTGDPTRGIVEFPMMPLDICVDKTYIAALLPNNTIELHSLHTLGIVAVLPTPSTLRASSLSHVGGGGSYLVPSVQRNSALRLVGVPLYPPPPPTSPAPEARDENEPSGSGLTPPPTPTPTLSRTNSTKGGGGGVFTKSNTLILGAQSISSLLPSTLSSQVDSLLASGRLDDAIELVDRQAQSQTQERDKELEMMHQKLGFHLLKSTRFGEAGGHFLSGRLDPLLLIRLFPSLSPTSHSDVWVYAGVEDLVRHCPPTIDDIVARNLVRNYHPHIQSTDAPATELRRVLNDTARDMLVRFLEGSGSDKVVNTTLLKIYLSSDDQAKAEALLARKDLELDMTETEPLLVNAKLFDALAGLYERRGEEPKVLEVLARMVDYSQDNKTKADVLSRMLAILTTTPTSNKDRALVQRYGIWMARHDPSASLKIFTSGKKAGKAFDEALVLRALKAADPSGVVGERYLEWLVVGRGGKADPALHNQLISSYVDRISSSSSSEEWDDIVRFYKTGTTATSTSPPFLLYLAETLPADSTRVKLPIFLQASGEYDLQLALDKLGEGEARFPLERAIVLGKLNDHARALALLVRALGDATTAEAYCTLGGEVVSAKLAGQISGKGYDAHVAMLVKSKKASVGVTEEKKRELLGVLMRVYMQGGSGEGTTTTIKQTAALLNAQAVNLDTLTILSDVPPTWSLNLLSSFLERSFRRTLHEQQEGMIVRGIAAAQNLQVSDRALRAFADEGGLIEEPAEEDEEDQGDECGSEEEVVDEKVGLEGEREGEDGGVVPIGIPPRQQQGYEGGGGFPSSSMSSSRTAS